MQTNSNIQSFVPASLGKIEDAGILVRNGRIDAHWGVLKPADMTGKKLSFKKYSTDQYLYTRNSTHFIDRFNLRSVEFGNWMNEQDRIDFLFNCAISLDDLAQALNIPVNAIGLLKNLSIALGARGKGRKAIAHYERLNYAIINLTKTKGFLSALAHEYGHAFDNLIHLAVTAKKGYLSGETTNKSYQAEIAKRGQFQKWFEDFYQALYFEKDKETKTNFYRKMVAIDSSYWGSRVEVWARFFEQYIGYKLDKLGIKNQFLCKSIGNYYASPVYANKKDFNRALPIFEKIIVNGLKLLNNQFKKYNAYSAGTEVLSPSQASSLQVVGPEVAAVKHDVNEVENKVIGFMLVDNITAETVATKKTLLELKKAYNKLEKTKGWQNIKPLVYEIISKGNKNIPGKKIKVDWNSLEANQKFQSPPVDPNFLKIPVEQIKTRSDFQNRSEDYSQETFESIVSNAKNGTFSWALLDPIVLWKAPDNHYYVVSGHSRTAAFKELMRLGYNEFRNIPAKVFKGTEAEAKNMALNSNTLSTKETAIERANYYRSLREKGKSESSIKREGKLNEKSNWSKIYAYTWLSPTGKAFMALKAFEKSEETSKNNILNIANWLGKSREKYQQLTHAHENELFDWLVVDGFGTKKSQVSNLLEFDKMLYGLIQKNTEFGKFKADQPLNVKSLIYRSPIEQEHEERKAAAQSELNEARKARDNKAKELTARGANQADWQRVMKDFDLRYIQAQQKLLDLKKKDVDVFEGAKNQPTLFGIGAVEILSNNSNVSYSGYYPTYPLQNDYSYLIQEAGPDDFVKKDTNLETTIEVVKRFINDHSIEVKALAQFLRAETLEQTAFNIFHFIKENIVYGFDLPGIEEIRSPAQTWLDRDHRADCEDMAIFTGAILKNLGIPFSLTLVAFNGKEQYGHIYITAQSKGKEVIIDGVMNEFDKTPPNVTKTTHIEMKSKTPYIAQINGLGAIAPADSVTKDLMRMQAALVEQLKSSSTAKEKLRAELRKVRYLILLNGTPERDEILPLMSSILDIKDDGKFVFDSESNPEAIGWYLNQLQLGRKPQEIIAEMENVAEQLGLAGIGDFFKKAWDGIKKGVTDAAGFIRRNIKSAWSDIQNASDRVLQGIKAQFTTFNPVLIAGRNAFLGLVALNAGGMASRMMNGYYSAAEVSAKGYDQNKWQEAIAKQNKVKDVWKKLGGKTDALENAVKSGAKKRAISLNGIEEDESLGAVSVAAAVATAAPIIAATLAKILDVPDLKNAVVVNEDGSIDIDKDELKKAGQDFIDKNKDRINTGGSSPGSSTNNGEVIIDNTGSYEEGGYNSQDEKDSVISELSKNGMPSWLLPTLGVATVAAIIYKSRN